MIEKVKGYKILPKNLKAFCGEIQYEINKIIEIKGRLRMHRNGLHLYKDLENIPLGVLRDRIFEAEAYKCIEMRRCIAVKK